MAKFLRRLVKRRDAEQPSVASEKECQEAYRAVESPRDAEQPIVDSEKDWQEQHRPAESKGMLIALYAYSARNLEDLSFSKGEELELLDSTDGDWWFARSLRTNGVGFVPSNYVSMTSASNACKEPSKQGQTSKVGQSEEEPRLDAEDKQVPKTELLKEGQAQKDEAKKGFLEAGTHCEGKYNFLGSAAHDLPFRKGEELVILSPSRDPNWFKAKRLSDGLEGMIPYNYVNKCSPPAHPIEDTREIVNDHSMPWFHEKISREEAEKRLKHTKEGSFLIRESMAYKGDFTLSVKYGEKVEHYRIAKDARSWFTVDNEDYFENLVKLVDHFHDHPDGLCCRLVYGVNKSCPFHTVVTEEDLRNAEKTEMEFVEQHVAEEGSLKIRVVRSMFYGAPAVGKTCTRKRLTGKIVNLGSQATLPSTGIEKPCTINLFHKTEQHFVLLTRSFKEWEEQNVEDQCQTLLKQVILVSEVEPDQNKEVEGKASLSLSAQPDDSQATLKTLLEASDAIPSPAISTKSAPQRPLSPSQSPPPPPRNLPKNGILEKFIKNVTDTSQWKEIREGLKAIEDITILHITDTGGQPEFYDILPLLLQGSAIFLLFLNLTSPLDEHCAIGYRWEEGRRSVEYESQFTVKEMLFQLLVSVVSHSVNKLSTAVLLVGTYLDRVGEEGLQARESELRALIQSTEFFKRDVVKTFTREGKNSLIFPLNNINGSAEEVMKLRELIASMIEEAFEPISLPTSWLLFHLVLRSEYEAHPGYCTLEQCTDVAESCGIRAGEVVRILRFMHKSLGTVLYYNEVPTLTNVVICDPNIIFLRATKLVTESFGANPQRPNMSQEIRESGEIDPFLMEEERKKEETLFGMSQVVDLLIHFNVISQIKKRDGSLAYFMPCLLLPDPSVGREGKQVLCTMDPAPLLILFSTGYVPLGLFSALIVHLSKLSSWVLDPDEQRNRNKVQFIVDELTSTNVVLISHIDRLELRMESPEPDSLPSLCPLVVTTIKEAIESLKSCHKYLKFHNSLGFYCSSDVKVESGVPHVAVCFETTSPQVRWDQVSPRYMRCQSKPKCAQTKSKLEDKHKVWFPQKPGGSTEHNSTTGTAVANQRPVPPPKEDPTSPVLGSKQLPLLKKLLSPVVHWDRLGLQLGISYPEVMKIEKEKRGFVNDCLEAMLQRWMQEEDDVRHFGGATKQSLIEVLREMDQIAIAEAIAQAEL